MIEGGDMSIKLWSAELRPYSYKLLSVRMYLISKCYVGFCTPRRTQMDLKKKKKLWSKHYQTYYHTGHERLLGSRREVRHVRVVSESQRHPQYLQVIEIWLSLLSDLPALVVS